jgi:hypothetical protein
LLVWLEFVIQINIASSSGFKRPIAQVEQAVLQAQRNVPAVADVVEPPVNAPLPVPTLCADTQDFFGCIAPAANGTRFCLAHNWLNEGENRATFDSGSMNKHALFDILDCEVGLLYRPASVRQSTVSFKTAYRKFMTHMKFQEFELEVGDFCF